MCWKYSGDKNKIGDITVGDTVISKNLTVEEKLAFLDKKKIEAEKLGITLDKHLEELAKKKSILKFRKSIHEFVEKRKELKKLSKAETLVKFKNAVTVRCFNELVSFHNRMIRKYPKLKGGFDELGEFRQINFAEFDITFKTKGKPNETIKELAHSGKEQLYDDFIPSIDTPNDIANRFRKGVVDNKGKSRQHDSEVKFIYNFLQNHLNKADEFVIETKNIYFTCNSCQRELFMLKEYAAFLGKKMEIIVHGDENVKRAEDLYKYIK